MHTNKQTERIQYVKNDSFERYEEEKRSTVAAAAATLASASAIETIFSIEPMTQ